MNKDKIIRDIKDKLNCSEEAAHRIFRKGLQDGMIRVKLNWSFIVTFIIYLAVLISAIFAIYRLIKYEA